MKHTLHVNKSVRYVSSILLILVFAFASLGATSQIHAEQKSVSQIAISNYLAAQQNSDLSDEEKIKIAIDTYFTLRYEGQKTLIAQDFSDLIEDDTLDWVKKEKDKRDIEIYIADLYDTPYVSYSYTLEYDSIDIDKKKAVVQLRESNEVVTMPDLVTSKMGNLPHTFTLHNKKGEWVIYKDEYKDEISEGLKHQPKEELLKQVDDNYQKSGNSSSGNKVLASVISQPLALTTYSYNRTLAKNYANTYWNSYNTTYYKTEPDTDCANYVSQSIYAGQGYNPPNTGGMKTGTRDYYKDWYYDYPSKSGPLPWIRVGEQYSFLTGAYGTRVGPYGSQLSGYCGLQPGDVIQLKNSSGTWFHEGIVVAVSSPCVGMQSVYVNAHTVNRYYMQLNGWSTYTLRYISISGWRK